MAKDFFGKNYELGVNSEDNKQALGKVLEDTENLYLCGFKLSDYLDPEKKFFSKFNAYLIHPSYTESVESAVLFMIALKKIDSAMLVQGKTDGVSHAWVEFTYNDERFVADFVWGYPFIMTRELFYYSFLNVTPEWICSYKDFWDLPLTKSIYNCMQEKETSEGVFEYLSEYHRKKGYGFNDVYSEVKEPGFFFPFKKNGKIISSGIIKQLFSEGFVSQEEVRLANELLKCAQIATV